MRIVLLLCALVILAPAQAEALVRVKLNAESANGKCLPPGKGTPKEILQRNQVQSQMEDRRAVPADVDKALSEVIDTIGRIGDGRFHSHWGVLYIFGKKNGFSFQQSDNNEIRLNPGSENRAKIDDKRFGGIMNRGVLAHELGHYVSNRDNFAILHQYMAAVPAACYLTDYARDVYRDFGRELRMEEFAEVFAAYITNPSLLARKGPACEKARRFVSQLFAETANKSESCESRRASLGAGGAESSVPLPKPRPERAPKAIPAP
ncbi:MAG: hypothetical protein AB7K68_11275 [Bacteriovoracia bacterium]